MKKQSVRIFASRPARVTRQKFWCNHPLMSKLTYVWEIMEESDAQSTGGDSESQPRRLPGLVSSKSPGTAQVKAPKKTGAYRLFVYALDNHGKAAYANIPFFVDAGTSPVAAKQ